MSKFPPEKTQPPQQESTTAQVLRQAYFDAFFAGANAGMLIFDRQLRYVQINEVLAQMNGICVADHIGRSVREVLPELAPTVEPILQGILDTGKPILDYELVGETPKQPGIVRYWQASYYPLVDANGMVFGIGGIVIEISDRKKAEQERQLLATTLENSRDFIGVVSMEGRPILVNQAGLDLVGLSGLEEARTKHITDFFMPEDRDFVQQHILPVLMEEGGWRSDYHFRHFVTGQPIPVDYTLFLVKNSETDEPAAIATITRDIRDRKQAEEALKQSEERFRSLIEASAQIIWTTNAEGEFVTEQPGWTAFTGQTYDECKGWGWLEFMHPDDRSYIGTAWSTAVANRSRYEVEFRMRRHDGEYRYMTCRAVPILQADGTIREWVGANTDITERKQSEDALRERNALLNSILENTPDIIVVKDRECRYVALNSNLANFMGKPIEEILGKDDSQLLPPAVAIPMMAKDRQIMETGITETYEEEVIKGDMGGTYLSTKSAWRDAQGNILGIIAIARNINDRKQAEAQLRDRNALLNSILESTPDFIVVKDRQGRYVALNSNAANFIGKPIKEIIGKDDLELLLLPEIAREVMAKDRQIMRAGIAEAYEEDIGSTTFLTTKAPWRDANGNILGIIATSRDISDRIATEKALQYNEERFRSLTEATSQMIWTTNSDGELVSGLSQWRAFTGLSLEELQGWGWLNAFHPDDKPHVTKASLEALANKTILQIEYRLRHHSGEYRYMSVRAVPLLNADGSVREWFGVHTDITERKQAEQTLRQTLKILDLASDSIIIRDMDDRIIYWNQGAEKLYGWTKKEVIGQYIHTFLQTVFPKPLETVLAEFLQQGSWEGELHHTTRDARHIIVASRWTLQRDEEGKPCAQLEINNDISDRKLAEDAIKQSEERYRSLILATSQIVWTGDAEGRCPDIPTLRAYTGQTVEEVVGFGWLDAMHPDDRERTAEVWMEAVQNKSLYDIEYRIRAADGNYRYFQGRAVPILNEDGSLREWVGTCTDIHDRKLAEFALAKAKEAAEAASRAKSEFLANMSHELRTPLNGIMGYAQILQRSKFLKEEERSRIDVIYQCGSHLLTLINDILDLSKIEAQKVELTPTDFHFPAFLQGVAEMCRIRAELKGIHFHFQSTSELPIGIRADEKRLRQVLINLLSNAIKFTDAGSVTFTVSFAKEGNIRFEVRDTGVGIARDQIQAIFQPFEQAGDRRRQTEGTGLGLAISQRIVELMGSTIEVQSELNVGSIFWFDVNLPPADEWVKTSQADDRGQIIGIEDRQPKILVVDDKWANRSVITNLLSPIGFEVAEAVDGQEGWQKIAEFQPDLVVTDLLMPELDGFELIKRIRESEIFKDIIIIVSSASVFETDRYRSIEAGGNYFLPKPIQATELLQTLQKYLHLEWLYEAHESPISIEADTNELIAPPATELETLYELAMKGNFREIVKQAALLEELDPKYIHFAKKLYQMAKEFQDEEIITFIQTYK